MSKKIYQFTPIDNTTLDDDTLLMIVGNPTSGQLFKPTIGQMKIIFASAGAETPNLQLVTNVGNSTTQPIISQAQISVSDVSSPNAFMATLGISYFTDNLNNINLSYGSLFFNRVDVNDPNNHGSAEINPRKISSGLYRQHYLPDAEGVLVMSVNGTLADDNGNVTIEAGSGDIPTMQQVFDASQQAGDDPQLNYVTNVNKAGLTLITQNTAGSEGFIKIMNNAVSLYRNSNGIDQSIELNESLILGSSNNSYFIQFINYAFPTVAPTPGQVLGAASIDGNNKAILSWQDAGSGGGSTPTLDEVLNTGYQSTHTLQAGSITGASFSCVGTSGSNLVTLISNDILTNNGFPTVGFSVGALKTILSANPTANRTVALPDITGVLAAGATNGTATVLAGIDGVIDISSLLTSGSGAHPFAVFEIILGHSQGFGEIFTDSGANIFNSNSSSNNQTGQEVITFTGVSDLTDTNKYLIEILDQVDAGIYRTFSVSASSITLMAKNSSGTLTNSNNNWVRVKITILQ